MYYSPLRAITQTLLTRALINNSSCKGDIWILSAHLWEYAEAMFFLSLYSEYANYSGYDGILN